MTTAGWSCDIDVNCTQPNSESIPSTYVDASFLSTVKAALPNQSVSPSISTCSSEPNHKRARLSQESTSLPTPSINGFCVSPEDKSNMGWPFRPDIMQIFRSTFDNKLKNALKLSLSVYLTRLSNTEDSVMHVKKEVKELSERMDFFESSSRDLKTALSERASLPTPTTGIGQKRTLSSQAPRLPPPSAVSQPDIKSSLTSSDVKSPSSSVQEAVPSLPIISTSPCTTAPLPSLPVAVTVTVTPAPKITTKNVPSAVAPQPLPSPLPALRPPASVNFPFPTPRPSVPTCTPLTVRPLDMIDLTAESSPTTGNAEEFNVVDKVLTKNGFPSGFLNRSAGIPYTAHRPSAVPVHPSPIFPPSGSTTSKGSWYNAHGLHPPGVRNHGFPFISTGQLSFRELQQLPVAPLPPIPFQPPHHCPTQPMPQLTIAEAAEGICLQWTLSYQDLTFEPAISYEIYSYASSEVTAETIHTCLPWKKVGEVAALPLPMACTLTHVQSNNLYYFIVRSVDRFRRYSPWSNVVNAFVG